MDEFRRAPRTTMEVQTGYGRESIRVSIDPGTGSVVVSGPRKVTIQQKWRERAIDDDPEPGTEPDQIVIEMMTEPGQMTMTLLRTGHRPWWRDAQAIVLGIYGMATEGTRVALHHGSLRYLVGLAPRNGLEFLQAPAAPGEQIDLPLEQTDERFG